MALPPNVVKGMERLSSLYAETDTALAGILEGWDGKDPEALFKTLNGQIGKLDKAAAGFVKLYTAQVVTAAWRDAEGLLAAPERILTPEVLGKVQSRFYKTFTQQHATIRKNAQILVEEGYKGGSSLYDNKRFQRVVREQGISGLKRSDGTTLSIRATGKAMVHTRTQQLSVESTVERYKAAGVTHVEFRSSGIHCTYKGEGGTCTSLNGRTFPIDDIPAWAQPPRHLYAKSRFLPVVEGVPAEKPLPDTKSSSGAPKARVPASKATAAPKAPTQPATASGGLTREQKIDNYRTMHGKDPSPAQLAKLKDDPGVTRGLRTRSTAAPNHRARKDFDRGVETILKVHNPDAEIVFRGAPHKRGLLGSFGWRKSGGDAIGDIGLAKNDRTALTAIHEIGHALDLQLFGRKNGNTWSMGTGSMEYLPDHLLKFDTGHPMDPWRKAVVGSGIRQQINNASYSSAFRSYLLSTEELWARSYEQWIVTRSGDTALMERLRRDGDMYWSDEAFKPIAEEMDRLLGGTNGS